MAATMARYKKEYVMYFSTSDEYQSYYLNDNVAKYMPDQKFDAVSGAPVPVPTAPQNETIWCVHFLNSMLSIIDTFLCPGVTLTTTCRRWVATRALPSPS